jgi:glycosyltransferase involved in cell wall biosynthesis
VDVLVVPSSEFDPFPTVLLEAGQAGVPVLAARVGGVAEIIVPEETGWLFEPGDWSGAAAKLEWLAGQSAPEFARCGNLTFQRQATDFTLVKMSAQYGEIFSRLTTNG